MIPCEISKRKEGNGVISLVSLPSWAQVTQVPHSTPPNSSVSPAKLQPQSSPCPLPCITHQKHLDLPAWRSAAAPWGSCSQQLSGRRGQVCAENTSPFKTLNPHLARRASLASEAAGSQTTAPVSECPAQVPLPLSPMAGTWLAQTGVRASSLPAGMPVIPEPSSAPSSGRGGDSQA